MSGCVAGLKPQQVRKATGQWWKKRQVNRQLIKKCREKTDGIREEM